MWIAGKELIGQRWGGVHHLAERRGCGVLRQGVWRWELWEQEEWRRGELH